MCRLAAVVTLAVLAVVPASAWADDDQESTFQDDALLVYGTPSEQSNALDIMKALGADRVRVTVNWRLVAPDPDSTTKPKFDAADPNGRPRRSAARTRTTPPTSWRWPTRRGW
jgi:hypothetical protein